MLLHKYANMSGLYIDLRIEDYSELMNAYLTPTSIVISKRGKALKSDEVKMDEVQMFCSLMLGVF